MKILIVDDSTAMRAIIRRALRHAGYEGTSVIEARDGVEALATVQRDSPDVVLSDWNMPNMSGLELLQAIRREGLRVQFGFITSEASATVRHDAAEAGALFLVTKPFTPEILQKTLAAALSAVA